MKYSTLHVTLICLLNNSLSTLDKFLADNVPECKFSISQNQSLFGMLLTFSTPLTGRDSIHSFLWGNPQDTSIEDLSIGLMEVHKRVHNSFPYNFGHHRHTGPHRAHHITSQDPKVQWACCLQHRDIIPEIHRFDSLLTFFDMDT